MVFYTKIYQRTESIKLFVNYKQSPIIPRIHVGGSNNNNTKAFDFTAPKNKRNAVKMKACLFVQRGYFATSSNSFLTKVFVMAKSAVTNTPTCTVIGCDQISIMTFR